jgi:hypothetical protein
MRLLVVPGSARVSRAGDGVLAVANFPFWRRTIDQGEIDEKIRCGATPQPARETRALPG